MSLDKIQQAIEQREGLIFSDGTLNLQHLLPKAYDILVNYEMHEPELKQEILDCFDLEHYEDKQEFIDRELSLFIEQYHGDAELREDKQELASSIWNEDIFNLFNDLSPEGYYFGSNEGDGACIGWFKFSEEDSDDED